MRRLIVIVVLLGLIAAAGLFFAPTIRTRLIDGAIARHMEADRTSLVADDALRVAVCGSGSPLPDPDRAEPCFLVIAGGRIMLVDAGSGSWRVAARWPLPARRLDAALLTHFHSDHIADLPIANMQSWVDGRVAPLQVYGGPGVERVVAGFNEAFAPDASYRAGHHGADFMPPSAAIMSARLVANAAGGPLTGAETAIVIDEGGLRVTAFAVEHPPVTPAYGYRIDYKGRSVVISGDTHVTPSVGRMAKGADVLIHEAIDEPLIAQMADAAAGAGRDRLDKVLGDIQTYHASPVEAAAVGREAGVRLVVLNHLAPALPGWLGERHHLRDVPKEGAPVRVAFDGMLITLPLNSSEVRVSRMPHD